MARTAIIAARQARPQFIRKAACNMLSVGPLFADRNVRAYASSKRAAANLFAAIWGLQARLLSP
jgi:hypothetical protein